MSLDKINLNLTPISTKVSRTSQIKLEECKSKLQQYRHKLHSSHQSYGSDDKLFLEKDFTKTYMNTRHRNHALSFDRHEHKLL